MNKYNNKITVVDGVRFSSAKESKRYQELKTMEKAGQISGLVLQPKFVLQDAFIWYDESSCKYVKERSIVYVADFKYVDNQDFGNYVVEDVKSSSKFKTDVYKIKRKLFLRLYCSNDRVTNPRITDPRITDPRITDPRITDPRVYKKYVVSFLLLIKRRSIGLTTSKKLLF